MSLQSVTPADRLVRLKRALRIAALVVAHYDGTEWEAPAIKIFERVEREVAEATAMEGAKNRARALLND